MPYSNTARSSRGHQTYWGSTGGQSRHTYTPDPVQDIPAGELVETVSFLSIHSHEKPSSDTEVIRDSEVLASYNWLNTLQPTILVPGLFSQILL